MPTIRDFKRDGNRARYFVYDDRGNELSQVERDISAEIAEAKRRKTSLVAEVAKFHGAKAEVIAPVVTTPIPEGEEAPVVHEHWHAEFDEVANHEHKELVDATKLVAQGVVELDKKLGEHHHTGAYAAQSHLHLHLEESIVQSQEHASRIGLEVAKVAERLTEHKHPLEDHTHELAAHNHPELQEIKDRFDALLLIVEGLATRLEAVEAKPEYAALDHGHEAVAHEHEQVLVEHEHPQYVLEAAPVKTRARKVPADHSHSYVTMLADGLWHCACGATRRPN